MRFSRKGIMVDKLFSPFTLFSSRIITTRSAQNAYLAAFRCYTATEVILETPNHFMRVYTRFEVGLDLYRPQRQ